MSNKARFIVHLFWVTLLNGLWAAFMTTTWVASIDLEVNKPFMAWLTAIGSAIIFIFTVLIIVMGSTLLVRENAPVTPAPVVTERVPVRISRSHLETRGGSFGLGFAFGSIVAALICKLLR